MVDEVLVADADALLLGRDAALRQVADDAVQQVIDVGHRLPRPEGNVHLAVVLEQLGLAVGALEAQRVEERALVRRDGHLLLVDADLQFGKTRLFLHGPQFGNFHNALQILWNDNRTRQPQIMNRYQEEVHFYPFIFFTPKTDLVCKRSYQT